MCRSSVDERAKGPLAQLLRDMAESLAEIEGCRPEDLAIGPVDFGSEEDEVLMASDEERAAADAKRLVDMLADPNRRKLAQRELSRLMRAADRRWAAEHQHGGGEQT